jgi:hypothetical protein
MISLPGGARARRKIAAGLAVGLALGAVAVVKTQSAQAVEKVTDYGFDCTLPILGQQAITTQITTTAPDSVKSGDSVMLDIKTSAPAGLTLDVTLTKVVITIPTPAQVDPAVAPQVMIMGGSLTGTSAVAAGKLTVTLTGNVMSSALQMPELMITSKLKSGIGGQTVNWAGPSNLDITASLSGISLAVPCTASAGNPPVAVTPVVADSVPTTAAPTTAAPTTAAPTTAAPTTAAPTTAAPTTAAPTTKPPTTAGPTTKPPTTAGPTTKPPTTAGPTTKPPTTKPPTTGRPPTTARPTTTRGGGHEDPFLAFLKRIICFLFHFGC